jgi:hypothetical protein
MINSQIISHALQASIHKGFAHEYPASAGIFCGDAKNWYGAYFFARGVNH